MRKNIILSFLLMTCFTLTGCNFADRLASLGGTPPLSPIKNPIEHPKYRPVSLPMPPTHPYKVNSNSLWRKGENSFFKDQRAHQVGDILTVMVNLKESAKLNNETTRKRANNEKMGADNFIGVETRMSKNHPEVAIDKLVGISSGMDSKGTGAIKRDEEIKVNVAAVVTQLLPNGNMVVIGRQEIRVNYEVRELQVAGVIRPEDITSQNTISSEKIAEARISYGGRGHISEVQQPRYGQQLLDVILPF